jgi:hypothetical protein
MFNISTFQHFPYYTRSRHFQHFHSQHFNILTLNSTFQVEGDKSNVNLISSPPLRRSFPPSPSFLSLTSLSPPSSLLLPATSLLPSSPSTLLSSLSFPPPPSLVLLRFGSVFPPASLCLTYSFLLLGFLLVPDLIRSLRNNDPLRFHQKLFFENDPPTVPEGCRASLAAQR